MSKRQRKGAAEKYPAMEQSEGYQAGGAFANISHQVLGTADASNGNGKLHHSGYVL